MKHFPLKFKRDIVGGRFSVRIGKLEIAYVKRGNRWRDWRYFLPYLGDCTFWFYWPWLHYFPAFGKYFHQCWRGIGFIWPESE